jgi:hypothetical protein
MIFKAAIIIATASFAFAGYQTLRLQIAHGELAALNNDFTQCQATMRAFLEGEEIDNAIPDDLGDFFPPDPWLLPSTEADR